MNLPNQLTVLRILLTPVFVLLTVSENPYHKLWGVIVFAVASLTDLYDGYHARKYGIVTRWGAFMDPLADKILISSAFFIYVANGYLELWMVLVVVARDVMVTLLRVYAELKHKPVVTSGSAKFKTLLQNVFAYILLVFFLLRESAFFGEATGNVALAVLTSEWTDRIMLALTLFTIYTGVAYLVENWDSLRRAYLNTSRQEMI
ncbi:MAG: CDP-diacylglycerol--glycerol-3-phosphate 3-phosphatidyltransferase [Rhizobacter sp.]|nr:CDP-diacylglycerol--glycerol-3-phosphate 3-phosphatidyltransferase [Chlorobiales bacterium]